MAFRQFRSYRVIAKNLSFSKAAKQLFMAQPSVFAQIGLLGDQMNLRLRNGVHRVIPISLMDGKFRAILRPILGYRQLKTDNPAIPFLTGSV